MKYKRITNPASWPNCPRPMAGSWSTLAFHARTDLSWPELGANVTHHPDRSELYSFVLDGVLRMHHSS